MHTTTNTRFKRDTSDSPQLLLGFDFQFSPVKGLRRSQVKRVGQRRFITTTFTDPKARELQLAESHLVGHRVEVITTHGGWHGTGVVEGFESGSLILSDYRTGDTVEDLTRLHATFIKAIKILE